jgi:hypothetical protein
LVLNWSLLPIEEKPKENKQGIKRDVLNREQNDERQHPESITLYIYKHYKLLKWGRLRPQGNKRKCIGTKGKGDRSERKQGIEAKENGA